MNTPRPKSLAILFLAGAFLTGGAVGYAAERVMPRAEPIRLEQPDMVAELARALHLRPEQKTVFDSVWAWRRAKYRDIMAPVRPALDSARDSARILMLKTLDSTQQAGFHRLIENQRVTDSMARARGR